MQIAIDGNNKTTLKFGERFKLFCFVFSAQLQINSVIIFFMKGKNRELQLWKTEKVGHHFIIFLRTPKGR